MSCNEAKTLSHGQYHAVVGEESVTLRIGSNPKDSQTVLVIPHTHIKQVQTLLNDAAKLQSHLIGIEKIRNSTGLSEKVRNFTDEALTVMIAATIADINEASEKYGVPKEDLFCMLQVYTS